MERRDQLKQACFHQGRLPSGPAEQPPSSMHRDKMYLLAAAILPSDQHEGLGVTTLRQPPGPRLCCPQPYSSLARGIATSSGWRQLKAFTLARPVAPGKKELLPMNLNSHKKEKSLFLFSLEPQNSWGGEARGLCDR